LAEDEESFVSIEGDFVVAVETSAVVDPAVGVFDYYIGGAARRTRSWVWARI
jgi:hypothetical protein